MLRRNLLKILALPLVSGLSGLIGCQEEMIMHSGFIAPKNYSKYELTAANLELIDFPEKITGAGKIERYMITGAKKCIVHIRQRHALDDTLPEYIEKIKAIQEDIYKILSFLADRGVKEVYVEAIVPETEDKGNKKAEKFLAEKEQRQVDAEICERNIQHWQKQLEEYAKFLAQGNLQDEKYIEVLINSLAESRVRLRKLKKEKSEKEKEELERGAAFWLACENRIELRAAETLSSYTAGNEMSKSGRRDLEAFLAIMEKREDILLDMVSRSEEPLVVCIFGGRHAFGGTYSCSKLYSREGKSSIIDNLDKWNKNNPDKKFSLIEITPERY
ncbi:hypothetical protein FJZ19_04505 [Candidatus Pacearchaeota archaeon]|nr:hypothetical protein [Candidatus Pacearchaeota archaeon]